MHSLFDHNTTSLSTPRLSPTCWAELLAAASLESQRQIFINRNSHCWPMFWPQTPPTTEKWNKAAIQNIGSHVEVEWFLWLTASACGETKNLRGLLKTLLNEGIINRMVGWIFSLCLEISYNDWIPYRQLLHDSLLPPSHLPSTSDSLNNIDLNAALPLSNEILIKKTRKN